MLPLHAPTRSGCVHDWYVLLAVGATCVCCLLPALGGNLGGITSWLLSLDGGQLAAATRADIVVPVQGFKRCYDAGYGFGETDGPGAHGGGGLNGDAAASRGTHTL